MDRNARITDDNLTHGRPRFQCCYIVGYCETNEYDCYRQNKGVVTCCNDP